jgi:hypothetical protein
MVSIRSRGRRELSHAVRDDRSREVDGPAAGAAQGKLGNGHLVSFAKSWTTSAAVLAHRVDEDPDVHRLG